MGVYIKGMEMPTSCDECPMFNLDIDGGCYCTKYFVIRKKDQDRPDWCPLVPVPPHGRLIDADALKEAFCGNCFADEKPMECSEPCMDMRIILEAPTIIEEES